ncbi:MAG: 2OG-Fe(II) oxygenase [Planctomycetota bacterium]|nr:2OG-Fe(II) oxygenase [Planctomycetota bacterium]
MRKFTAETLRAFVPLVDLPYEAGLVYENVFTPRQCERIVQQGLVLTPDDARVGIAEGDYVEEEATRKSRTAWIEPADDTLWIFDKLTKIAQRANRVYGFDLIGFTEDAQFTMYDEPGAFYDWHQDGLSGELAGRKLSLVVQLSDPDDYTGGELELHGIANEHEDPEGWAEKARARGSVIVFPAFELHRVLPMETGKRYSLVCWIGGPPFR